MAIYQPHIKAYFCPQHQGAVVSMSSIKSAILSHFATKTQQGSLVSMTSIRSKLPQNSSKDLFFECQGHFATKQLQRDVV
jgi:hypothetical protein